MKSWLANRIVLFIFTLEQLVVRLDTMSYVTYMQAQKQECERLAGIFIALDSLR